MKTPAGMMSAVFSSVTQMIVGPMRSWPSVAAGPFVVRVSVSIGFGIALATPAPIPPAHGDHHDGEGGGRRDGAVAKLPRGIRADLNQMTVVGRGGRRNGDTVEWRRADRRRGVGRR